MSDLYAIGYPNLVAAEEVVGTIAKLQAQDLIHVDDAVIVERRGGDKMKLHRAGKSWAGQIGHLFSGSSGHSGIDEDFTRSLGAQLDAGNVALILLVSSLVADQVLEELR